MKTYPVLVYVAGPYRATTIAGIRRNIENARAVAEALWAAGIPALCPHLNSALMDGLAPDEVFLAGGLEMLRRCDAVALVPGWDLSAGTCAELAEAARLRLPVFRPNRHQSVTTTALLWAKEREREECEG